MTFEAYLQAKGMVKATITRHSREIKAYHNFLERREITVESATKKQLLDYLQYLREQRNISNDTLVRMLRRIKNYYQYLHQYQQIPNIAQLVTIKANNKKVLRPIFTSQQLDELCELYYNHTKHYTPSKRELRFYADYDTLLMGRYLALTLICYQGLQIGEVLAITADAIDLRKGSITIEASRRGNKRSLPLQAIQIGTMMQYFGANDKLLPNLNHFDKLSRNLMELTKRSEQPFLDFRQLRTSVITHWIHTEGLRKAQYLAGHRSIIATQNYKGNTYNELQQGIMQYHPLG